MNYVEQFEQDLVKKLDGKDDSASIVRWAAEKLIESYKNGIAAGQKGATLMRKGASRRSGYFGKAK